MKEELVTHPTAKLAKEKGFDIITEQMYGNQIIPQLEQYNQTRWNIYKDYYLAPSQSLLQRWLREVHNINVIVDTNIDGFFVSIKFRIKYNFGDINIIDIYNIYELALETGLQEALKLIP
jgi:hypothetical protein